MKNGFLSLLVIFSVVSFSLTDVLAQGVEAFPPIPPLKSSIEGAIDFHVHSAPDVFERNLTDFEIAMLAARMGMKGLVFKNHVTNTADRAFLANQLVPGIEIFGGIVLNKAVGGINPNAVEWMHRMAGGRGKVVWLPTIDADYHLKTFNESGEGIKVTKDGKVLTDTEAVLKVISRENLVLHTGHISPEEVHLVIKRAKELGVKNIVVTHALAEVPGLSLDQMKEASEMGAYLELVYLNHLMGHNAHMGWMKHWKQVSISDMAEAIKSVGAEHFILSSDLGQTGNPTHPDGYKKLVTGLMNEGITQEELGLMMKKNPAKLLGIKN